MSNYIDLIERIKSDDQAAAEEFYVLLRKNIKWVLYRIGPQDLDDLLHDVFLIVMQAIKENRLDSPENLVGYVRGVAHNQFSQRINKKVFNRENYANFDLALDTHSRGTNPEKQMILREKQEMFKEALDSIKPRDREIILRFYIKGQSVRKIIEEMNLKLAGETDLQAYTRFRLVKSRAKKRIEEYVRNLKSVAA